MKTKFFAFLLIFAMLLSLCAAAAEPARASGLTADGDAMLVTDVFNKVIWRISGGHAEQYAGKINVADVTGEPIPRYLDSTLTGGYFMEPWDIAPFLEGYAVSDAAANVIRYVCEDGIFTASGSGLSGHKNGVAEGASFDYPTGLAAGDDGRLYIADTGNNCIRVMAEDGTVTDYVTGLAEPTGLCWADGALYVAETGRSRILRIENGAVTVLAGVSAAAEDTGEYYGGFADGPAAAAEFDHPQGVAVDEDGTVYIADTGNHAVRAIADGRVITLHVSADTLEAPISPRGLLAADGVLYAADVFTGEIAEIATGYQGYADVADSAWYAQSVKAATLRGLVDGVGNACFAPETPVTRAAFATMLSRVYKATDGSAVIDGEVSLPDIEADSWYGASARWAVSNGVVNGIDGNFCPAQDISREQLVTMLYRFAQSEGYTLPSAGGDAKAYPDFADTHDYAQAAMCWAVDAGILNGFEDGTLRPLDTVTRAQAAKLMVFFMDKAGI